MKIEDIIDKDIAVYCSTEAKAEKFLEVCERQGITWSTGEKPTDIMMWKDFKNHTCYSIHHEYGCQDGKINLYYGNIHDQYYSFDIIDYDDLEEVQFVIYEEENL